MMSESKMAAPAAREIKVLSPTAILGYGFPESSFEAGLARDPDVIAVDAGSSDPGPYYLGAGVSFTDRAAVKRDLRLMLRAARARDIPLLIGSAGGCGARPHLDWTLDIIREIATEDRLRGRLAAIPADVDKAVLCDALASGRISSLPGVPLATPATVNASTHIVAQMGEEPLLEALAKGANVIVAGRCYDPAVFAAVPIARGFDRALALHMGKILECAAIAATPGSGSDCMLGTLSHSAFTLEALSPNRRCTVASVAAHTLYEKSDPYHLPGPGGSLDLTETRFEQLDEHCVRVSGSRFSPARRYAVKLEGASPKGFRTISIAGARDPVFIAQIDTIIDAARRRVADNFAQVPESAYRLIVRVYGRDGVMGELEPQKTITSHEICLVIEAVAETQALADTICGFARATLLHFGYPGRISTAGNLAFPYSPSDFKVGQVFEFSLYHLLEVDDPNSLFSPVEITELQGKLQ
ncbi:acyclic terpene utilization AtuA family protein [Mesorhizobium silamurunense]|uniref:acyclic terpene utilization AtuA family protein n=1 Tax=Mesorhizobium silamurunense TaxID=499528 RepID=UPI001FE5ABFE|nr:acyclic terpene utilization AtuA family protein [Mesorhizobium silamurunense]